MRINYSWVLFLALMACQSFGSWDIFLLFGQSNMAGVPTAQALDQATNARVKVLAFNNCTNLGRTYNNWYTAAPPLHGCYEGVGPGDWFAKTLIDSSAADTIGLVPCALSGVDIDFFRKNVVSARRSEFSIPPDNHWTGAYEWMIQRLQLAQKKGTIKGILLHQGESDNGQQVWVTKVKEIITNLKTDLGLSDLPFMVGELPYNGCCSAHNKIIAQIPSNVTNSAVVSASGLTGMLDVYHFDLAGQREMGKRYAKAYLGLAKIQPVLTEPVLTITDSQPQISRTDGIIQIDFSSPQEFIELYSMQGRLLFFGAGSTLLIDPNLTPAGMLVLKYSDHSGSHSMTIPNIR